MESSDMRERLQRIEGRGRREPPESRYQRDPQFHALVDLIEQWIRQCEFTPTEVREAAMLAAIRYELRRPPRSLATLPREEWERLIREEPRKGRK